jgi:hypothetical protein
MIGIAANQYLKERIYYTEYIIKRIPLLQITTKSNKEIEKEN